MTLHLHLHLLLLITTSCSLLILHRTHSFTISNTNVLSSSISRDNLLVASRVFSISSNTDVEVDTRYFSTDASLLSSPVYFSKDDDESNAMITLPRYLNDLVVQAGKGEDLQNMRDLESILLSIQMACKTISNLVNRAGITGATAASESSSGVSSGAGNGSRYDPRSNSQIRLDLISTIVLQNALRFTGKLRMISPVKSSNSSITSKAKTIIDGENTDGKLTDDKPSEHQPGVIIASGLDSKYVACLDPLDGSGNADAAICTATTFGIFENQGDVPENEDDLQQSILQPGKNLRAAGYCLYSSATILIFSIGDGVHGFTLDPQLGEFVLTHPNIRIPKRGNIYSCNEANSEGWTDGINDYLKALKTGKNQTKEKYTSRYVGSMVGDIHRTLMYGGIFLYPSDTDKHPKGNLQLLYKSIPLGYLVEQAGGKSLTSKRVPLLEAQPQKIHERAPCFFGSPYDINELKRYL